MNRRAAAALLLAFLSSGCDFKSGLGEAPGASPAPAAAPAPAAPPSAAAAAAPLSYAAAQMAPGAAPTADESVAARAGRIFDNTGAAGSLTPSGQTALPVVSASSVRTTPVRYTGSSRYPVRLNAAAPPSPGAAPLPAGPASYPADPAGGARGAGSVLAAFDAFQKRMYAAAAPILSRAGWGAAARRGSAVAMTPTRLTVHHTDGNQTMSEAATAAEVRSIQQFHMQGHGWDDIGYHFLIDGQGRVVEGRPAETLGAHAQSANANNIGIAMMGNFDKIQPTGAQVESLKRLVAFLAIKYHQNPSTPGFVEPHMHYNNTDCPGKNVLALLGALRAQASGETTALLARLNGQSPGQFTPVLATNG